MRTDTRRRPRGYAPWGFLLACLAWSWTWWGLAAALPGPWLAGPSLALFVLGGLGPLLVAAVLVGLGHAAESPAPFWRRAVDPRGVAPRWWVVVVALATLPPLLARLLSGPAGGPLLDPGPLAFLVVGALAGAAEEPGWRGYAQHGLQQRIPVLTAGLIVGIAWAAWHVPLFWIDGTYQHGLGVGTAAFWAFHAAILAASVVYGWLHNAVGGATIAAVAFHAVGNVTNELLPADGAPLVTVAVQAGLAVAVTAAAWGWIRRPMPVDGSPAAR
jgi:uncharacterized protein